MTARALPFTRFCAEVLRVRLTPGQHALCSVAFDRIEPCDLVGADRDLARQIFGDVDTIPASARHVLAAMCGARGGKSYVLGGLRLLHLALTVDLDSLAPGELAAGVIVAPDLRLARQALRYAIGAAESVPEIQRLITATTADNVILVRPDGASVDLVCLPATRGGSSARGRTLIGAVLDEAAFFRDGDTYQVNDAAIFEAVAPRVVPGGQVIIASTPYMQSGLLFESYERNHGHPIDAIAAHAPTLLLRDDEHTRLIVERETMRDEQNAQREYGAIALGAGSSEFFDAAAIKAAIDEMLSLISPPNGGTCGLDTAFRKDASAGVVVHWNAEHFIVAEITEIKPEPGRPLVPSLTIAQLLGRAKYHGCERVASDQHYIESVREVARGVQLIEAPHGSSGKIEMFTLARRLFSEGKVKIPAVHKRLIQQLREVISKPTTGGGLSISSPRHAGSHGDLVSAFVLALWAEHAATQGGRHRLPRVTLPEMTPDRAFLRPRRGALWR